MKLIDFTAIYTLWLREILRFFRLKSRVVGSLGMPLFFLIFLGMAPVNVKVGNYIDFLTPGIIGMVLLFASMFAGISVLWDKEFGFLKEIMVAPVSRVSIVLGRTAGGVTTAMMQGFIILALGIPMGLKITGIYRNFTIPGFIIGFFFSILFMILISATFIGLGLAFASKMEDMSGYSLVMNFLIFPIFFLSGALFPLDDFPLWLQYLAYIDPLTYGVDGLRGCLIGYSEFPLLLDFSLLSLSCIAMIYLGAYLFERSEVE
ncbi:MAG: ABC transporter permease [Candidatus Syntropharchaeia archaeon]